MEIVILFGLSLFFIAYLIQELNKHEKERFDLFVKATKSKTVDEYKGVEKQVESEVKEQDELLDLDEVDPEKLLKMIRNTEQ